MSSAGTAPAEQPAPVAAADGSAAEERNDTLARVAHGALRGTIAAWAMTGMRSLTVNLGLVEEPPPRAILRQKSRLVYRLSPKRERRIEQELLHCAYGAVGGVAFALLPERARLRPWAGAVYGLVTWLWFELVVAPLLGLVQAKKPRPLDRLALAGDHVLYGVVLSETRRRPRE